MNYGSQNFFRSTRRAKFKKWSSVNNIHQERTLFPVDLQKEPKSSIRIFYMAQTIDFQKDEQK